MRRNGDTEGADAECARVKIQRLSVPKNESAETSGYERKLANLRPWPKGVSGNPSGRPKNAVSITEALRKKLKEKTSDGQTLAQKLAESLIRLAMAGNSAAIREVLGRVEGPIALTTEDGGPLTIVVRHVPVNPPGESDLPALPDPE